MSDKKNPVSGKSITGEKKEKKRRRGDERRVDNVNRRKERA